VRNGKEIIFKGEYLNGKRNGHGIEYGYHDIIFEGEYLNGMRNGHGKKYDSYSDGSKMHPCLTYEGEYLNGKKYGKGKEFWKGFKTFEGEYLYGYRLKGKNYRLKDFDFILETRKYKGVEYLEYEGEYLYDKIWNGKGYDEDGNIIYEIINGKGKGIEYYNHLTYDDSKRVNPRIIYEGEYLNGTRNGKGRDYDINSKLTFEGEYLNGKRWNGKITVYSDPAKKLLFEGELLNGKKNGKGKEYFPFRSYNRIRFESEYLNGLRHGKGKQYDLNGNIVFDGEYFEGKQWKGKEKQYDKKGNLSYELEYLNGKIWNGKGKEYLQINNLSKLILDVIFEGQFLNGERWNGKGKEYNKDGKLLFEVEYVNGKKKITKSY